MRLDALLHERCGFESREKAKKAILDGRILVNGERIEKPSAPVEDSAHIEVIPTETTEYVSRGGIKLAAALEAFGIGVKGFRAIDIGASTGGFTDCLLRRGASRVYAVDVGHGQLHKSLADDARVVNRENVNARYLTADAVDGEKVDIAVSDLSFISQKLVLPAVLNVLKDDGLYICLVKPQFEVGRSKIGKNGIVKDAKAREQAVEDVIAFAETLGFSCRGRMKSPITGGSGNTEYLAVFGLDV